MRARSRTGVMTSDAESKGEEEAEVAPLGQTQSIYTTKQKVQWWGRISPEIQNCLSSK